MSDNNDKNYYGEEAIKKLKTLAEDARFCFMATSLDEKPIPSRPMSLQEVSEDGMMWFISSKESDQNYDIQQDSDVQLYFMNNGKSQYLSIYGTATIYTDQQTIDEKWSNMANAWFEDGKHSEDASIIGIKPNSVKYWGNQNGKLIDTALMLYSAVTGDSIDTGKKGELNI